MTYCADDVNATHAIFKQMWPQFETRYGIILCIEFYVDHVLCKNYTAYTLVFSFQLCGIQLIADTRKIVIYVLFHVTRLVLTTEICLLMHVILFRFRFVRFLVICICLLL